MPMIFARPAYRKLGVLTALAILLDGLDSQALSFALPAIAGEWGVEKGSFGIVFMVGLIGMSVGTILLGHAGDRIGRPAAMAISVVLFGLFTGLCAIADGVNEMLAFRFIAGLGMGGAIPNAAAIMSETVVPRWRPLAVTSTILCIPLGGMVGGFLASWILPAFGWRPLFVGCGLVSMLLGIALFLERRAAPVSDGAHAAASPGFGKAAALLLAGNVRRDTLAIWAAYFWSMMAVYLSLNWLPSLLAGEGFDLRGASLVAAIFNCGGIVGALLGAALIRPFGSKIVLVAMALGGGATSALLVAWPPHPGAFAPTLALLALLGVFSAGIQSILFAVAAQLYAVETRATAIGVAVGFGRTGAMISAIAGGALIGVEGGGFFVVIALLMTMLAISLTILRKHVSRHHDAA
jgi:AAHS family 4-hydroxybenzoate transporter-like MFS transporter